MCGLVKNLILSLFLSVGVLIRSNHRLLQHLRVEESLDDIVNHSSCSPRRKSVYKLTVERIMKAGHGGN